MRKPIIPTPALAPAAALVWWVVGYLPWLVDGMGDDVADRYAAPARIAIPVLTAELSQLVLGALVGGACAGLLTLLAEGRPATVLAASFSGVAAAVLLAGIQSESAVREAVGGGYQGEDSVISALLATAAVASLVGWLFGAGGYFGPVPLGIAIAGLAGLLPLWLGPLVTLGDGVRSPLVSDALNYTGAATLAAGLVVIGVRPYRRLFAWPVAVALAWIALPAFAATGYLEAMLRPPAQVSETLGPAWEVFTRAASPASTPTPWMVPYLVAVGLAVAISVRLQLRGSRQASERGRTGRL